MRSIVERAADLHLVLAEIEENMEIPELRCEVCGEILPPIKLFNDNYGYYAYVEQCPCVVRKFNEYKKLIDSIYEISIVQCSDAGETFAGIQSNIEELRKMK